MTKFIECFSYAHGQYEAAQFTKELNELKSDESKLFSMWHKARGRFIIMGSVTQHDWDNLNLESDFMSI